MEAPVIAATVAKYTAAELITILASVGVLIGSIVTGVVTIIGTLRNGQKTDALTVAVVGDERTPGLINQVQEVHTVVNSNLAAVNAQLSASQMKIEQLISTIRDLKQERDKIPGAATHPVTPPPASAAPVVVVVPSAPAAAPIPPGTVNLRVNEVNADELNVPGKKKEEPK